MPSPFPGMDPFIENQEWSDFHVTAMTCTSDALVPQVESDYIFRLQRRNYMEHEIDSSNRQPEEQREAYLVIRERESKEVVTVVELLSPANKRPGSDGRKQYLSKRDEVLQSFSHLVEIDLLRGGERLPTRMPLPQTDYYVIISRRERRPRGEVYPLKLTNRLPVIPIPLKAPDPDIELDLQEVVNTVYQRARYDLSIDYTAELAPPLTPEETNWLQGCLKSRAETDRG